MIICSARSIYTGKSAVNLPDPFIRVRSGNVVLFTSILRNETAPTWNEKMTIPLPWDDSNPCVEVELWHHSVYDDQLLGKYVFYPAKKTRGVVSDDWYALRHSISREAEIRLRILCIDIGLPPPKPEMWKVTDSILKDPVEELHAQGKSEPDPEVVIAAAAEKGDLQKDSEVSPIPLSYITYCQAPEPGVTYTNAPAPVYLTPLKGCYQVPNAHITASETAEPELVYSPQAVQISGGRYVGHPPIPSVYARHPGFRY